MTAGPGAPPDLTSVPTYHTDDVFTAKQFYRDADARVAANGEIRLVQTGGYGYTVWGDPTFRPYNLIAMRFNTTTGMLVPNSIEGFSLFEPAPIGCNPTLGNTGLAGCALAETGAGAYVVGEVTSDCVTSSAKLGFLDFASGAFTDITANIPSVSTYTKSRFYRNRSVSGSGEAIYVPRNGGVDELIGITSPASVTAVSGALASALPPLHEDQPGQNSGNFQPRFLNTAVQGDTHLSTTSVAQCCTYFQTVPGAVVGGHTQLPGMQPTSWNAGSNPLQPGSSTLVFNCDLVVETGASLYLNNITLRFTNGAKVTVKRGGLLYSYNTTYSSLACPDTRWPGVRVEGTSNELAQSSAAQGRFWLTNGSVIENAVVGTWCARENANGTVDGAYYGGVVRGMHSTYKNCISGVRVENYHRYGPSGELNNLSFFTSTSFRTTASWPAGAPPFRHAQVVECKGVSFSNCNWVNEIPLSFPVTQRGRGIVSRRAPFRCVGFLNANNRFENLEVGALVMQMPVGQLHTMDGMTFHNNFKGVVDMGTRDAVITNNKFKMLAMPTPFNQTSIGIHLFQSNGYTIERNTFLDQGTSVPSAGIWFMGPAFQENQIYDNTFTDINMGCVVQGRHLATGGIDKEGLQMLCGDHSGNLVDQWLWADGYIKENQGGSSGQPYANNRYFSAPNCGTTFEPYVLPWHPFDSFVEYHHWDWNGDLDPDPEMRPECVEDPNGVSLTQTGIMYDLTRYFKPTQFDKEVDCGFGELDPAAGGGQQQVGLLMAAYRDKMEQFRSAVATYTGTVDHGYTQDLEVAINYQPWHPSHYLRDYMLARHPLSDEVIKAAIHRVEPLDPWHLTQVLIQNSPLSPEMYRELELTEVLPEFFHNMLMQYKEGVSLRSALEGEIRSRQIESARLLHQAVWAMSEDSLTTGLRDSLATLLLEDSTQAGLARRYQFHLDEHDFAAAANLAPTLFVDEWTDDLAQMSALYESVQGDWQNTSIGQRELLFDLAYTHAPYTGAWAWSALLEIGALDSLPSPETIEAFKSLPVLRSRYGQNTEDATPILAAFPNPATDRVQITYARGLEYGTLQLFDAQGRKMMDTPLNGQLAFKEIPLNGYAEGLYMARVILDGFVLGETKFTVFK